MTGYGLISSWNVLGSSSSPGPLGSICDVNRQTAICPLYSRYGCDCSESDGCWWSTCWDTVELVISILDQVEDELCVDLDRIWAVGCSNGGMFAYTLATDE